MGDRRASRYVVGITRWGTTAGYRSAPASAGPDDQVVQALAAQLGVVAYEVRLRLAGPLPVVLGPFGDVERARELLAVLHGRGLGATACDLESVVSSAEMHMPDRVTLTDSALQSGDVAVPYDEIVGLIRATHERLEQTEATVKTTKTSLARMAISGGLVRNKTSTQTVRGSDVDQEQVLYVFRRSNVDPWLLRETWVRYAPAGEPLAPTAHENFDRLVRALSARVPHALADERMVRQKRRPTDIQASGGANRSRVETSNASETDLAAHLIVLAHLSGQLAT